MLILLFTFGAFAHEVQPAVADVFLSDDRITIKLEWVLEAPVAGIDLDGLDDTNTAENAPLYDELRALNPAEMEGAFRKAWPDIRNKISILAGNTSVVATLDAIRIPEIGNPTFARISEVELSAALANDGTPVIIGWTADLGPLVVRQQGVEDGYTAYLTSGTSSDPIPRSGGFAQSAVAAFVDYISVGFDHIVPKGLDHILFVLGLFFLALKLRPLLWQISAFTLAHTVTLALGALDIVRIPGEIVEPLIAASIVYVGVENVFARGLTPWRPVIVFMFGLLHGLGFASVLADFGLGSSHFVPKLIGFNVGVELGQLTVIAVAFLLVGNWFGQKEWYTKRIANPASIMIALVGAYWVVERTIL